MRRLPGGPPKRRQLKDRAGSTYLEHLGIRLTVEEWARKVGLDAETIRRRLRRGVGVSAALSPRPPPMTRAERKSTYMTWKDMLRRCNDPRSKDYGRYGERGIAVCERWGSFESFLSDMGLKPEGKTIERVNGDGMYEPSNCRWATPAEQARNTSRTVMIERGGVAMCASDWGDVIGIGKTVISRRKRGGWPSQYLFAPKGARLKDLIGRKP